MENLKIKLVIFGTIIGLWSGAQTDSIYNRYTDKFRLESISLVPTYSGGFTDVDDKKQMSFNLTFSKNKNLFQYNLLAIDIVTNRNTISNSYDEELYRFHTISYGKALYVSQNFHLHSYLGVGVLTRNRSNFTKTSPGLLTLGRTIETDLGSSSYFNTRLGSAFYYDFSNSLAIGVQAAYNLNSFQSVPEIGLSLTFKPKTREMKSRKRM